MTAKEEQNRYYVETFGCQMNVNDSERVAGLLEADGWHAADSPGAADFVFINTCAVREKASEKLYSALGRLRELRSAKPELRVGVGGCVAQLHGEEILDRAPELALLVGTHNVARVPELLRDQARDGRVRIDLDRGADSFTVAPQHVAHGNPYRAYVTVMEGCNHVCSFCVVPRTRGTEVCRDPHQIVAEVQALVERGVPEVMLLGQTVNAYRHSGVDFVEMLARVAAVPGLCRLRFTTSHPSHMTAAVARSLGQIDNLCPYIHLPVQSGSDRVLAEMRRGYTRSDYFAIVESLRDAIPDLSISSDVIVGYPGETESEFEETLSLVEECRFEGLFVFTYSPRPGTTALRLDDDVPDVEKLRRLKLLNDFQQRRQASENKTRVGRQDCLLVEGRGSDGRLFGRTPQFRICHVDGDDGLLGKLVDVEITEAGANSLRGRVLSTAH